MCNKNVNNFPFIHQLTKSCDVKTILMIIKNIPHKRRDKNVNNLVSVTPLTTIYKAL